MPGEVFEVPTCGNYAITIEVGSETSISTASAAFPNQSSVNNYNVLVKGTFTIDKDISFIECRVFFDENAGLVTNGMVKLTGISSWFVPCGDKTWQGMVIRPNGAISLNECTVIGADIALNLRKGYRTTQSLLVHNNFGQNRICIFGNESLAKIGFSDFYGNVFSGAGTLPGQPTVKPLAGVQVTNCTVNLGSVVYYPANDPDITQEAYYESEVNTFKDFKFGIDATGSTVIVRNCWFHNMRPDPDANGVVQGCGISAVNSRLSISGEPDSSNHRVLGFCTFSYCAFAGIKSNRTRLDVNLAQFRGLQYYGIRSVANNARPQSINRCEFLCGADEQVAGISIERPWGTLGTSACNIIHNNFKGNGGDGLAGIEVTCIHPFSASMTISDNTFDMDGAGSGGYFYGIIVYGNQSNKIKILNNSLDIAGGGSIAEFGIFLVNCEGTGHEVSGNTSTGNITCNFHIEKSRNVKYCDNISNQASNGFHFYGDNINTNWAINSIGAHGKGLYIQDISTVSNGKIGFQIRKGNMWDSDDSKYADKAARCDAVDFTQSRFLIEDSTDISIFPKKTFPQTDWFKFEPGTLDHCGTGTGVFVSSFERRLAEDSVDTNSYTDAELWEVKRMLLRTLMDNPAETDSDSVLKTYLSQYRTSAAGRFASLERRFADYSFANAGTVAQLESAYSEYDSLRVYIDALSQTAAGAQLSAKIDDMVEIGDTISVLLSSLELSEQSYLQQLVDTVATITATQSYEQAWKTLKTYELKIAAGETPAAAGIDDLKDVAYGDQETLGAAVRHAWYRLPGCERYGLIEPNEESQEREEADNTRLGPKLSALHVQPNPASETLVIGTDLKCKGTWTMRTLSGIILNAGTWTYDNQMRLDARMLASGLYYFILKTEDGRTLSAKVSVIH